MNFTTKKERSLIKLLSFFVALASGGGGYPAVCQAITETSCRLDAAGGFRYTLKIRRLSATAFSAYMYSSHEVNGLAIACTS